MLNLRESIYYIKDGEKINHGLWRSWYNNDQLESEHNYKDGKDHGIHRAWHPNGKLKDQWAYKDGEPHGPCKSWYDDGRLAGERFYWEGVGYDSEEVYKEQRIANKGW